MKTGKLKLSSVNNGGKKEKIYRASKISETSSSISKYT